ncbi:MAG: asparagine synthase (glutamine-hydrolyzing) [Syntrophobacterales bacterium]|jgi:asparagine synthase (glutamine-hydrolysing)
MCGFVGFISSRDFQSLQQYLPDAVASITHRGPDDSGRFFDERYGIGLGHRRLSIIDLSEAGRQPMSSDDGTVHIVYNGEVYNFREIRETLEKKGHEFKSSTDTEVILKSYIQWGIECLQKFVGMFSLAIWDSRNQCLYLARDRLGIKPLFYYFRGDNLLFASELKGLMAFKTFEKDIDPDSIPLFLHYQYVPAPRTIFKNTYKLLPGNYLKFDGKKLSTHVYWSPPDGTESAASLAMDEEELVQQLDLILTQAVDARLISDVPLGALLSGGIDSSMVVALMQKVRAAPVRTFSIGFDEEEYNEAPWAAKVANHLGTDHTELYVTPREAMEVIPKLPEIYDEPFADSSAIPTFLVCQMARDHVKVALSGDGGDEQFSGYVRYWSTQAMATGLKHLPRPFKSAAAALFGTIPHRWVEKCYLPWRQFLPQRFRVANFPDKWQKLVHALDQSAIADLYRMTICLWSKDELPQLMGKYLPESQYEKTFSETEDWPLLSRLMRVDQRTYLPDAMLTKVDRASMAVSLEVRVPLLDHRVVEHTAKLPDSLKYKNGTGKFLLKRLLGRYLPAHLIERPKMGFGVPIDRWFRRELKDLLLDYLSPERLKNEALFDYTVVENRLAEHLSGQVNHHYRLWALLMWEMWRERWLGGS